MTSYTQSIATFAIGRSV